MPKPKQPSWGEGELRELLSLMMIGSCFWIIGTQLGMFAVILDATRTHNLQDLLMLALCLSVGLLVAMVRKSFKLRRAMQERDRAEAEAESVARHDALTGLANRRRFRDTLDARLRHAPGTATVAVLLVDLDRFKPVNDVHGHAAGDAVLCAAAERLRECVPADAVVARLDGDEFAILVDARSGPESLGRLAQAIIAALSRPVAWAQDRLEIGATVGVVVATAESRTAEALLHAADVAMCQGKREGRGVFRFFHPEMGEALRVRARLEAELRLGIGRGEIAPFYQPVVSLPDRSLIGFEVLARWHHPTQGLLVPDAFIPLAEATGLIDDLTWSLMRQACRDARSWPIHLQLAINISPLQLQDRWLPERILAILAETGFAPGRLEIEITETALVADLEAARTALKSLQDLGIRIALDDFGTGYSSLYYLRELQFDKLKIDRSYVTAIPEGTERAKLADAIIALSSSLGLLTTAEGIETASSVDWLAGQGCTYGQGYLFGKPMSKAVTDTRLVEWSDGSGNLVIAARASATAGGSDGLAENAPARVAA